MEQLRVRRQWNDLTRLDFPQDKKKVIICYIEAIVKPTVVQKETYHFEDTI
jgi:hypothetical protein